MNNYQNENRINDTTNGQVLPFPHPTVLAGTNPTVQTHYYNENNYIKVQENFNPPTYSAAESTQPQSLENPIWYRPQHYSNRSSIIQVGNDCHQVFVYEDESAKNELVEHSLTNDCSFKTSPRYYMYCTLDNRRFRSVGEVCIYFALKDTGYLFHANSSVTAGSLRKEPDFSIIYRGKVYILDVLNNGTHNSEKDAKNVRFFQNHGIAVRSYTSEECVNYPHWVVNDFLTWVQQQN